MEREVRSELSPRNLYFVLAVALKTKTLSWEKTGRLSTKSVDLSSSFFQQFAVVFDL